jgi:hypothetical protein
MRHSISVGVVASVASLSTPVHAQEQIQTQVCTTEQANLNNYVSKVQSDFQQRVDAEKKKIQDEADEIKKDAPKPGGIGFDFDVKWTDQKIILDLPEVTIKQQKWIYDIPQVTMTLQEIIFGTPSVRMVPKKIGQYPEFHGFTVKWSDIITNVPETFMQEQHIQLHLPEFKVDRTETELGVPEFTMGRQEIILRVPEFKLNNIRIEANKAKARGEALSTQAKSEMTAEVTDMKSSLQQGITSNMHQLFNCMRSDMQAKRANVELAFAAPITQLDSAVSQLEAAKAVDKAAELMKQRDDLLKQRDETLKKLDEQLGQLDSQEQKAFDEVMVSLSKNW